MLDAFITILYCEGTMFPAITTKYLGLALVSMWNNAQRKGSISVFQELSASIDKAFILAGGGGARVTRLLFYEV